MVVRHPDLSPQPLPLRQRAHAGPVRDANSVT